MNAFESLPNFLKKNIYEFDCTFRNKYDEVLKSIPFHLSEQCHNNFHEVYRDPANTCEIFNTDAGSYGHSFLRFQCKVVLQVSDLIIKTTCITCANHLTETIETCLTYMMRTLNLQFPHHSLKGPLTDLIPLLHGKEKFTKNDITVFCFGQIKDENVELKNIVFYVGETECYSVSLFMEFRDESLFNGYYFNIGN